MYPWWVSGSQLHARGGGRSGPTREVLAELLEEVAGAHAPVAAGAWAARTRRRREPRARRSRCCGAATAVRRARRPRRSIRDAPAAAPADRRHPTPNGGRAGRTPIPRCRGVRQRWAHGKPHTTTPRRPSGPPPAAGIRDTPLSVDEVFAAVGDDGGRHRLFVGTVRDHDGGHRRRPAWVPAPPERRGRAAADAEKVVATTRCGALRGLHLVDDLEVGDHRGGRRRSPARTGGEAFDAEPEADRRPQERGADLEAPDLRGRPRPRNRWRLTQDATPSTPRTPAASPRLVGVTSRELPGVERAADC